MVYRVFISNITSHEFYMESGVLPMHRIICDTLNELTGEKTVQTVLLQPGPERKWEEIQKNGYVLEYKEDELSTVPKEGFHYRYICSGTIRLPGNIIYAIEIPTSTHYQTEAEAKNDNSQFFIVKFKGVITLHELIKCPHYKDAYNFGPAYSFDQFRELPFSQWSKLKPGADTYWLEPESFEPCSETFEEAFASIPDLANDPEFNLPKCQISVDIDAYRIEEEEDEQ